MLLFQIKNKILWIIGLTLISNLAFGDLDDIEELDPNIQKEDKNQDPYADKLPTPDLGKEKKPKPPTQETKKPPPKKKPKPQQSTQVKPEQKHDSKAPIQWKAQGFRGTREGRIVNLKKDVEVTQGALKLTSDKSDIYFDDLNEVTKVIAVGNVKVVKKAQLLKDRIRAHGNEAIFYNSEQKIVLKGNATLIRGNDVVRGKQISYDLNTGWITV